MPWILSTRSRGSARRLHADSACPRLAVGKARKRELTPAQAAAHQKPWCTWCGGT